MKRRGLRTCLSLWFLDAGCSAEDLWLSHAVCDAVHALPRAGLTSCGAVQLDLHLLKKA